MLLDCFHENLNKSLSSGFLGTKLEVKIKKNEQL